MKGVADAQCRICPLKNEKYTPIKAAGIPKHLRVIVVQDFPTIHDAAIGVPMTGEAGALVRALLEQNGLDPGQHVYFTSAALCWPIRNKEVVAQAALAACRDRLRRELAQFATGVYVLALGAWSQKILGIELRDHWEHEKLTGKLALAAIHPNEVLMTPTKMIHLEMSIKKFAERSAVTNDPNPEALEYDLDPYPYPDINQTYGRICLDIETTSTEWYLPDTKIFLVGIATQTGHRWIFTEKSLQQAEFQAWLRSFVAHHGRQLGGHNYKFDVLYLNKQFGTPLTVGWDTLAMVNVLNEHWYKDLKTLATYFYNADDYAERLVHNWLKANIKKTKQRSFDKVPKPQIYDYILCDIEYNLHLSWALEAHLHMEDQWEYPYQEHEVRQVNMLTKVENTGFAVDLERIRDETEKMGQDVEVLYAAINHLSEGDISNPSSTKEVVHHLYNTLGLPVHERTPKGQPSVSGAAIREYAHLPVVQGIAAFRRVRKLKSSYLDNIHRFIVTDKYGTPRVHPTIKHWKVITHRLSVENPALQTIPHTDEAKDTVSDAVVEAVHREYPGYVFDGDYGTRIKGCYIASPGNVLVAADGEGWEVSCAVAQSKDPFLAEQIRAGNNVHSAICDKLFGPGWTKAQRVREKNVFFGWMYGGTVSALVHETGIEQYLVQEVVDFLEGNLTGLKKWRNDLISQARQGKIILPHFNYHFHFDLITANVVRELPKVAVNYPNQGLGSILISRAAIIAQPTLAKYQARIVMLVHDQYLVDTPEQFIPEVALVVRSSIAQAGQEFSDFIPWRADVEVGPRWSELEEYKL